MSAAPSTASQHAAETPRSTLVKNAVALFVLLGITVGANFLDLGSFNVVVALLIALIKAALIVLIFMEVRHRSPVLWMFVAAGFFWLLLMLMMTMADYSTRSALPPDWLHRTGRTNHVDFSVGRPAPTVPASR
ncbi:MAG: cytochrome C oxidase subunit IV family protein [Verrucomicrobia bacterium]|nr:cytochrome C oxidase subunit IV family protein [Verrucomicrobiota bacterium]